MLRAGLLSLFLALGVVACGGRSAEDPVSITSGSGGSHGVGAPGALGGAPRGTAGASAAGGPAAAASGAPNAGASAGGDAGALAAGAPSSGGSAAAAGGGEGPTHSAGAAGAIHPRITEVLRALEISDAAIEAAEGEMLLSIARDVGLAYGYGLCSCFVEPADDAARLDLLEGCAPAEAGVGRELFEPHSARCIVQLSAGVPGFDEYVRCQVKALRHYGELYKYCSSPTVLPPTHSCMMASPGVQELLFGARCHQAFFCADETLAPSGHCDRKPDCPDLADERNCAEFRGQDTFVCGGELLDALSVCASECGTNTLPQLCDPAFPLSFQCGDGTSVESSAVCDTVPDCGTRADEEYCLR